MYHKFSVYFLFIGLPQQYVIQYLKKSNYYCVVWYWYLLFCEYCFTLFRGKPVLCFFFFSFPYTLNITIQNHINSNWRPGLGWVLSPLWRPIGDALKQSKKQGERVDNEGLSSSIRYFSFPTAVSREPDVRPAGVVKPVITSLLRRMWARSTVRNVLCTGF